MSAFLCSAVHLSTIVNSVRHLPGYSHPRVELPKETQTALEARIYHSREEAWFSVLLHENLASVGYRYPKAARVEDWTDDAPRYVSDAAAPVIACLKLLHSYQYQACEHAGWPTSTAKAYTDALLHVLPMHLPGYEDAPWSV